MAIVKPTYVDVIAEMHSDVQVSAMGDGRDYTKLVHGGGEPIPSKATLDANLRILTQDRVWRAIQAERDRRTSLGGYKVGSNWFHSDQASRIQQIALVVMGAGLPPGIMWKTMSGTFVQMTQQLAVQIFQTAVQSDQIIFAKAEQHRAAMMQLEQPELYDFSGGWPMTFEEYQRQLAAEQGIVYVPPEGEAA